MKLYVRIINRKERRCIPYTHCTDWQRHLAERLNNYQVHGLVLGVSNFKMIAGLESELRLVCSLISVEIETIRFRGPTSLEINGDLDPIRRWTMIPILCDVTDSM